jgi:hypothetical protein
MSTLSRTGGRAPASPPPVLPLPTSDPLEPITVPKRLDGYPGLVKAALIVSGDFSAWYGDDPAEEEINDDVTTWPAATMIPVELLDLDRYDDEGRLLDAKGGRS